MAVPARFGGLPPLVSGVLALLVQGRVRLVEDNYASSLAPFDLHLARFDMAERAFALRGLFEWRIAAIASIVLTPGDTVFEGGAQLGTETFNYCALVGRGGQVVTYEADPGLAARLANEAERLGRSECRVQAKALGAQPGTALFEVASVEAWGSENSGLGSLAPNDSPRDGRIAVDVATLDDAFTDFGAPAMVVLDIQGGELGALRGASRVLQEARPVIVLEVESGSLARLGGSAEELFALLTSADYDCWRLTRLGLRRIERPRTDELGDWLVVPRERPEELLTRIRSALWRGAVTPPQSRFSPLARLRT